MMKILLILLLASPIFAKRLVCYTTNWSQYRPDSGKFMPENIDPQLCTHLIYAFAVIKDGLLASYEWNDESTEYARGLYDRTTDLKKQNPQLKVLLAVGGWNFGSSGFSSLASNIDSIRRFATGSVTFLKKYNFDGLDIDWEYPANREGSSPQDKQNFPVFVQELRNVFSRENLLLTAALAAGKSVIDSAYEIDKIINNLDFVNVMTYDYHGAWDPVTGPNTPFYSRPDETGDMKYFNVNFTINYYLEKGVHRDKINLGLATYGRSFKLTSPSMNEIGAPASGPGTAGKYTRQDGFLAYYEICQFSGWTKKWDDVQKVTYIYSNDQWAGFDDRRSLSVKIDFLNALNLGGAMIWAIDMDDFNGNFCNKGKYPMINYIKSQLSGDGSITTTTSSTTATTTNPTTDTTKPADKPDLKCPDGVGYYPDKSSGCKKYYICTDNGNGGYAINVLECPSGLLFDAKYKVCNFPSQVTC